MGNVLLNSAVAASPNVQCKAGDIIQRDRFDASSIQSSGKIYVSNRYRPGGDFTTDQWTEIDPIKPGFYVLDFPVQWVGGEADFAICSYCSDNS